jgi:hypothetical protein
LNIQTHTEGWHDFFTSQFSGRLKGFVDFFQHLRRNFGTSWKC